MMKIPLHITAPIVLVAAAITTDTSQAPAPWTTHTMAVVTVVMIVKTSLLGLGLHVIWAQKVEAEGVKWFEDFQLGGVVHERLLNQLKQFH